MGITAWARAAMTARATAPVILGAPAVPPGLPGGLLDRARPPLEPDPVVFGDWRPCGQLLQAPQRECPCGCSQAAMPGPCWNCGAWSAT